MLNRTAVIKRHKTVKFLTVVWSKAYIERFLHLSLASFLAPGNIPDLVKSTDLEVVIMTRENDVKLFTDNPSFKTLKSLCRVRFVDIDDLIADGLYGITLTLAYARPIIASGEDMLNTHFVFMNADFVLADGSLRSLIQHIHDDRSIILGPSYRSITEKLEPILEKMVDANNILDVAPRTLVSMALQHPHRTTLAKIHGQNVLSSSHPNQLFWPVDKNTVLGKYFLSFMLCLKPERLIKTINCFCDYALIPELCPSGDEVMMGDSDEFFMLELQSYSQETEMLRIGSMTPKEIAASLTEWATPEHLRVANHDVVFHAAEIPENLNKTRMEAKELITEIRRYLGKPKSHRNHHYWISGIHYWKKSRKSHGLSYTPKELAPCSFNFWSEFSFAVHETVTPVKKILSRSNPYWQINMLQQRLFEIIREAGSNQRILIVGKGSLSRYFCNGEATFEIESPTDLLNDSNSKACQYDHIIYLPTGCYMDEDRLFLKMRELLAPHGSAHVFSSCKNSVISTSTLSVIISNLLESFEGCANSFDLHAIDNLPLYLVHRPILLAKWRRRLGLQLLLSPMFIASAMVNIFMPREVISSKLNHPVAFWLRVRPSLKA